MGLPVEVNNLMLGSLGGYTVGRSLRFRSSASAYLQRTNATTGTDPLKFTVSGWMKRGLSSASYFPLVGSDTGINAFDFIGFSGDNFAFRIRNSSSVDLVQLVSTAVFRDFSAWYHFVAVYDSANATSTERVKLYVNGVQLTAFATATYPSLNQAPTSTFLTNMQIGRTNTNSTNQNYGDGYLAEVNFIDGQALTPSSFGAYDTNGVWQPKKYTGTYGTNGFYLPFSNTTSTTTLVQDSSGNGNNWTPNNISLTAGTTYDSMIDSPTNSASSSNYCVLNPLDKNSNIALSDGNLTAIPSSTADYWLARATMQLPSSGKWYWELTLNNTPYLYQAGIYSANRSTNGAISATGNEYQVAWGTAYTYIQYQSNNAAFAAWGTNTNPTSGNVLMFAVDSDNATMWIGRNGTWYNTSGTANPATNTDPRFSSIPSGLFAGVNLPNPASGGVSMNFGQRPFSYTPPSGFKALNTYNLPAPSIANGAQYMAATLFTGNVSTNTINNGTNTTIGTSFQPDMVWLKSRSNANNHTLYDSIRGINDILYPNLTNAAVNSANNLTSFNSNGYTLGANENSNDNSGESSVGWSWKGGGTGVSNTSGSITSTVSANTTAGFSIVTYTGTGANATVGHGLGVAPSMVITKSRSNAFEWDVYHIGLTSAAYYIVLNSTAAQALAANQWNSTAPTSSVFSLGSGASANTNGATMVAYCFAAVRGYSAMGSYVGTGSSDGPMIYTGFRPRWIMVKSSTTVHGWEIYDTSRDPYNVAIAEIDANSSAAEYTAKGASLDFLSNGFKIRYGSSGFLNASGQTYIYMAIAESPFQISRAR